MDDIFNAQSMIKANSSIESQKIDRDYILFIPEKGQIVNLNTTASLIWDLIQKKRSLEDLTVAYSACFSKSPDLNEERLRHDVVQVLRSLHKVGAVIFTDDSLNVESN